MDNKLNNMLNEFFANTDAKNDEELNEKLQEFIVKYNNGEIDYTNTILDDAYEVLEQAEKAKTKNQAIKLAKKAYEMCPNCFDAILFQVDLEENSIKRDRLLNEGLDFEKDRLEEEKEMLKLYKKYPEEALEMLFPQFALYYKLGKDKETKELLERINKANPHFIKFFKGTIKRNEDIPYRHYSKGDSSEVIMYFEQYDFLVMTLPSIHEFILENSKKSKIN